MKNLILFAPLLKRKTETKSSCYFHFDLFSFLCVQFFFSFLGLYSCIRIFGDFLLYFLSTGKTTKSKEETKYSNTSTVKTTDRKRNKKKIEIELKYKNIADLGEMKLQQRQYE